MNKWLNYVLLLVSAFVAILIGEIFLRIVMPEIGWAQREDDVLGWSNDEYKQFTPNVPKKKQDERRILFLGDSYLAGSGVSSLNKRFPILLDKLLGDQYSVAILAAGGWGTDQQLLAFRQKGRAWNPDLIVLAFCANNDIANILSHHFGPNKLKPYFVIGENDVLELYDGLGQPLDYDLLFQNTAKDAQKTPLKFRSYLVDLTVHAVREFTHNSQSQDLDSYPNVDPRYQKTDFWGKRTDEINNKNGKLSWSPQDGVNHLSAYIDQQFEMNSYGWKLLERILIRLNQEAEHGNAKLVVMMLPVIVMLDDLQSVAGGDFAREFQAPSGAFTFRSAEPGDRLRNICKEAGIPFFNPSPEFIDYIRSNNLMKSVWPNPPDHHFSEVGHQILATISYKFFLDYFEKMETIEQDSEPLTP
ncbi:SGNH/GDSL hydrolase family protein [candidate division KSB1 bacterium]|nr:SGNH/GDSL hydrolase family protein [candidate division KSB1 bacterium]NIV70986.1 hypothetical protein [Phycisphaerae bacterium]NIR73116.1 SGNH/GDSL hydrolase family protein [candidate division KSB1 bacterium]NIT75210.1 SGNH/GDSL hydrolase family protein [candidate division KSB1 bacterium]NIU29049.1 SGNH/GDSL hydrolase family protein [candidate division KSB1 bacterium]